MREKYESLSLAVLKELAKSSTCGTHAAGR